MKKHIVLLFIYSLINFSADACEICGCANGNFQIGLLPNFTKGFLGIRYNYSRFHSVVRDEPAEFSRDQYQSIELWGGYNFKKFQVMAFAPYLFSQKVTDDGTINSSGVGDFTMLLNYKVLSATKLVNNEKTTLRNELYFGGGVKLPTGVNKVDPADPEFNLGDFNSQAGTGSFDFIVNATHNLMWNNSGVVTNIAYRINTANKQEYKFGNRTFLSTAYYYTFTKSKVKIKPSVGVNYQANSINRFNGEAVEQSNGYNFNSTIGMNVLRGKVGVNAMTFIPVTQNNFDGQTKLKSRFLLGVTYSF
jgi:hypothetical protein